MIKQNAIRWGSKEAKDKKKEKEKKQAAGTISESRLVDILQFIKNTDGEISYNDQTKLNQQYRAALKNNVLNVDGISIDRKKLIFDKNKENFLSVVRFDVYSRIYDDIKGNTLVEKQVKKKFNAHYKKITKTEPEDFYYKEYLKYAIERFNKDNPPLLEDPLSLDIEDQGSSSGPKTIRESGNETVRANSGLETVREGTSSGPETIRTREGKFSFMSPPTRFTPGRRNLTVASTTNPFTSPDNNRSVVNSPNGSPNLTGLGQKHKLSKSLKQLLKKYNL
jgi:hypothetical protein